MYHHGPCAGAGREQLVQQLLQRFPQRFALPRQVTDRKPGKGEKETSADVDFVKPDVLAKMGAQGQVVWSLQDAAGSSTAVTAEAVSAILTSGQRMARHWLLCRIEPVRNLGSMASHAAHIAEAHSVVQSLVDIPLCLGSCTGQDQLHRPKRQFATGLSCHVVLVCACCRQDGSLGCGQCYS